MFIVDSVWLVRPNGATAYIKREGDHLFFCAYHGRHMPTGGQATFRTHSEDEAIAILTGRIGITPDDVWRVGVATQR